MKKILIVDGQGGRLGRMIAQGIEKNIPDCEVYAVGTNSIATSEMLKGGARYGATGENPVKVLSADADFIIGPIGIVSADSLLGEITPSMAVAIGQSRAKKILIPVNQCDNIVAGVRELSMSELVDCAIDKLKEYMI